VGSIPPPATKQSKFKFMTKITTTKGVIISTDNLVTLIEKATNCSGVMLIDGYPQDGFERGSEIKQFIINKDHIVYINE